MPRTWKIAVLGLAVAAVTAPGASVAMAPEEPPAPETIEVADLLAYVDAEIVRTVNEMGGTLAICPACPPGMNCCTANCILTCCTIVCATGATPHCSCGFATSATCFCDPPPKPKCLDNVAIIEIRQAAIVGGALRLSCASAIAIGVH